MCPELADRWQTQPDGPTDRILIGPTATVSNEPVAGWAVFTISFHSKSSSIWTDNCPSFFLQILDCSLPVRPSAHGITRIFEQGCQVVPTSVFIFQPRILIHRCPLKIIYPVISGVVLLLLTATYVPFGTRFEGCDRRRGGKARIRWKLRVE